MTEQAIGQENLWIDLSHYMEFVCGMLKKAVSEAAADESTGGVAFLTRPPQAAKTACSPSGLR